MPDEFLFVHRKDFVIKHASFALVKLNKMLIMVSFKVPAAEEAHLLFSACHKSDFIGNFWGVGIILLKSLDHHFIICEAFSELGIVVFIFGFRFLEMWRFVRGVIRVFHVWMVHLGMIHLRMVKLGMIDFIVRTFHMRLIHLMSF